MKVTRERVSSLDQLADETADNVVNELLRLAEDAKESGELTAMTHVINDLFVGTLRVSIAERILRKQVELRKSRMRGEA